MDSVSANPRVRRVASIILALIVISTMLIVLDGRDRLDPVKGPFGSLLAPITGAFTDLGARFLPGRASTSPDIAVLQQERDRLLAENAQLREVADEVEQLRAQLALQQARPELQLLTANVVSRDPESLEKYIIVDRGSADGIGVGMAVVSPDFLVGQVIEVDPNQCKVLLVVDSAFQTGGRLQASRGTGIVYGRWQAGERAVMRHIPLQTEIVPGELVVTSGLTTGVPEGLVIGQILDLERDPLRNEIEVSILPLVDFDRLQTVTIILGAREQ